MKKIVMKIMGGCCAFLLLAGLFACKEVKVKTASSTAYFSIGQLGCGKRLFPWETDVWG